jgi:hypothetical protein
VRLYVLFFTKRETTAYQKEPHHRDMAEAQAAIEIDFDSQTVKLVKDRYSVRDNLYGGDDESNKN